MKIARHLIEISMDLLEKVRNLIKGNELRALETLYRNEISKLGKIAPMSNCEKIVVEDIDGMAILRKDSRLDF